MTPASTCLRNRYKGYINETYIYILLCIPCGVLMANSSQRLDMFLFCLPGIPRWDQHRLRSLMNRCVNWDLMV